MHSESYGATISTNPLEALALTAGANFGVEDSHDTYLNDAYVRGAVDFMHSRVRNQGCVVMNIENAGASYEYVPGSEVHDSTSFAIGLSGLDLTSADAFAYSFGKAMASSAASMGVGMLASEAGLGGFVSTIAASLAGTYVNMELSPEKEQTSTEKDKKPKLPSISPNSAVSYEHNGRGFRAINIDFGEREFATVINKIKENIFTEALDKGLPTSETVERIEVLGEWAKETVASEKAKGKSDEEAVAEVEKNTEVAKEIVKIDQEVRKESLDTESHGVSSRSNQAGMDTTSAEVFLQSLTRSTPQETSHEKAMRTYLIMRMLEYSAQPTQENRSKLNKTINVAKRTAVKVLDSVLSLFSPQTAEAMPLAAPAVEIALVRMAVWLSENPQFISNAMSTISGAWNLGQILEKRSHNKGTKKSVNPTGQMPSTGGAPNLEPEEPEGKKDWHKLSRAERLKIQRDFVEKKTDIEKSWGKPEHKIGGHPAYRDKSNSNIYYTEDGRHGDIEVWKVSGKRAEHQGSMEPVRGQMYRGANHKPESFE